MGWGMLTFACTCVTKLMLRGRCGEGWGGVGHVKVRLHLRHEVDASWLMWGDAKRVDRYMSAVFSFGGTTEEICLRRWPERGRKCKENIYTCKTRVRQKRVHFLLFPNLNSTLQVLTPVKNGMKAHMIQTLPHEKMGGFEHCPLWQCANRTGSLLAAVPCFAMLSAMLIFCQQRVLTDEFCLLRLLRSAGPVAPC